MTVDALHNVSKASLVTVTILLVLGAMAGFLLPL